MIWRYFFSKSKHFSTLVTNLSWKFREIDAVTSFYINFTKYFSCDNYEKIPELFHFKNSVKSVLKCWFHGSFCWEFENYHTTLCGNFGNLLSSYIFAKNFVKPTFLLKKSLKEMIWRNYCGKIMAVKFCNFHRVVW